MKIKTLVEEYKMAPMVEVTAPIYDDDITATLENLCCWANDIETKQNEIIKVINEELTRKYTKEGIERYKNTLEKLGNE